MEPRGAAHPGAGPRALPRAPSPAHAAVRNMLSWFVLAAVSNAGSRHAVYSATCRLALDLYKATMLGRIDSRFSHFLLLNL